MPVVGTIGLSDTSVQCTNTACDGVGWTANYGVKLLSVMEQQQKFKLLQIFCTLFAINILCLLPDRCLVPAAGWIGISYDNENWVIQPTVWVLNSFQIVLGLYHFSQFFQKTKFEEKIGWLLTYGYV